MHTEFKTIWQSNIFEVPCCGSKMKSLRNGTQVLLLFHLKWVFLMLMLGLWAAVHLFTLRKCTAFAPPPWPHTHTSFPWSTIAACVLQSSWMSLANTESIWGIAIARWCVWQELTCLWWSLAMEPLTRSARPSLCCITCQIRATLNLVGGRVGLFKTDSFGLSKCVRGSSSYCCVVDIADLNKFVHYYHQLHYLCLMLITKYAVL